MKKFLAISFVAVAAIASLLLFSGQTNGVAQEEGPSTSLTAGHALDHSPGRSLGRSLPAQEVPELPTEKASYTTINSMDILLVNAENPLPNDFRPENLVNLYEQKDKCFQLATADIALCETVYEAMNAMFSAAQRDDVRGFIINSGYRSTRKQAEVFANAAEGIAARPGTSEHETGLAFDVTTKNNESFDLTPQFRWLSKHCGEYGFILRYPKGKEDITSYPYESWHYRYVGKPHANAIMDAGITLEEYLEQ